MNRKLINWMGLWGLGALISYHNEPCRMLSIVPRGEDEDEND